MQCLSLLFLILLSVVANGEQRHTDCQVSIIGAGIGGVYSAWRLAVDAAVLPASDICIFEAKNRIGGRILTVRDPIPGFEGFTVDLGAYRFHRSLHHQLRQLTEDALGIQTQCYTDPLGKNAAPCGEEVRQIVATRGKVFGIKSNGTLADDAFRSYSPNIPYRIPPKFQWGAQRPLSNPRGPFDFLLGPNSVVTEIANRWDELVNEPDYATAMRIADEIILAMRDGAYRGIPYSEISLLQAATREGLRPEEKLLSFDTDWDAGQNIFSRMSLEHLGQLYVRYFALLAEPIGLKSLVTPVEERHGVMRRIGMRTMIDEMLNQSTAAGVRVFFRTKVTSIRRVSPGSNMLQITFADGSSVVSRRIIGNVGKPDLLSFGLESEPLKSSGDDFRTALERLTVYGLSKTYCFWGDAWWLTKMGIENGRTRTNMEDMFSMRYHDGDVVCENKTRLTGCRGGVLVSYVLGDNSGAASGIYVSSHNALRYTPLTNLDNGRMLIPGEMSGVEKIYFDDLHRQLRRVHRLSLKVKGFDVADAIPDASGCVFADWRDVGVHVPVGPGKGSVNIYELYTKPVADLDISLVNEAWGQDNGWAESSLNSAERALYHRFNLEKPSWMDEEFHLSVIRKFNQG